MKKYFLYFVVTFILLVATAPIRYWSLINDFGLSHLVFFIFTYFVFRRGDGKWEKLLTFLTSIIIFFVIITLIEGFSIIAIPNIISIALACILSFLFVRANKISSKVAIVTISLTLCSSYVFWAGDFWINYINYGTFRNEVQKKIESDIGWTHMFANMDASDSAFSKDKIIILDFYITSCGVCFRKFPELQNLYDKYKADNRVSIFCVNIPMKTDGDGLATKLIRDRYYTFPILLANEKLESLMKITSYPTVLLIQHDSIFYKGDISKIGDQLKQKLRM